MNVLSIALHKRQINCLNRGGTDIIFQTRSFLINIHGPAIRLQCSLPKQGRDSQPVGQGRHSENDHGQILEILACSETVCGFGGGFPSWFLWLWLETFQFMGRTRGFLRSREKKFWLLCSFTYFQLMHFCLAQNKFVVLYWVLKPTSRSICRRRDQKRNEAETIM